MKRLKAKKQMKMNLKCNQIKYAFMVLLGIFTVSACLKTPDMHTVIYSVSTFFLMCFSISDIKTRTISAVFVYTAMCCIYLMRFYALCRFSVEKIPLFILESIIVLVVFYIISKFSRGKIGNGDFDVAYIVYLSVGLTGLFYVFLIACLLSFALSLPQIVLKHKNLKLCSVPFIPYMYIGYSVLLLAKELIFI